LSKVIFSVTVAHSITGNPEPVAVGSGSWQLAVADGSGLIVYQNRTQNQSQFSVGGSSIQNLNPEPRTQNLPDAYAVGM